MKKTVFLILALILCASLLYGCSAAVLTDSRRDYNRGGDTVSGEVENLDVDWTAGSVTIAFHAENTVIISETAEREIPEEEKLLWKLDRKTLRIEYHKPALMKLATLAKDLTITLPEGIRLKQAAIRATSANVNIPRLQAETLILETTSGDADASAEAKTVKVSSTSGRIYMKLSGKQESVDMRSTSGSISLYAEEMDQASLDTTSGGASLEAKRFGTVAAESTSGNLYVKAGAFDAMKLASTSGSISAALPQTPGFSGTVTTTSGDISSFIPLEKKGDTYSCGDGSAKLTISATSGNVTLHPAEE